MWDCILCRLCCLIHADFKQLTRLVEHGVLDSEYVSIMLMIHQCSGMYFQMLIYYYCFVQSRHTYVMCVYISILLVLIFGVRRVYVNHGTVIFVQFNVQQASIHGVRARIELTELNFCVLPNSHRREIQLHQT